MDKKSDIPGEGDPVKIIPMDGHVFSGLTGVIVNIDAKTNVAIIKLDKPFYKENELPVHLNKLQPLEQ